MSKSKRGNPSHSKAGRAVLDGGFYLLGSVLYALSVNIFTAPNQIAPGGVTGVATLLKYAFHLPIGTMILVINLPLLIAAWYKCGAAFTVRTLIVTVLSSAIIDGTARFHVFIAPPPPAREIRFTLEYDPSYLTNLFAE